MKEVTPAPGSSVGEGSSGWTQTTESCTRRGLDGVHLVSGLRGSTQLAKFAGSWGAVSSDCSNC